jgi:hypothetical protein
MADHGPAVTTSVADIPIPVSRGFPLVVRLALLAGVAVVLAILGLTATSSMFGHVWPWSDAMRIPLTSGR